MMKRLPVILMLLLLVLVAPGCCISNLRSDVAELQGKMHDQELLKKAADDQAMRDLQGDVSDLKCQVRHVRPYCQPAPACSPMPPSSAPRHTPAPPIRPSALRRDPERITPVAPVADKPKVQVVRLLLTVD